MVVLSAGWWLKLVQFQHCMDNTVGRARLRAGTGAECADGWGVGCDLVEAVFDWK